MIPPLSREIPPRVFWPTEFTTDWVTGWFDWVITWRGAVDVRPAAWWHDLRYFAGYPVHHLIEYDELMRIVPRPNSRRSELARKQIDKLFRIDLLDVGAGHFNAWRMYKVVQMFGSSHYFWFR